MVGQGGQGNTVTTSRTDVVAVSFLPVPADIPVCGHNPGHAWSETLTPRLRIENAPPHRLLVLDGEVIFRYRLDNQVEERFILLRLIANGWITARELARRWGVSRNTIGNWSWRYRYFGLDGLADGRLPAPREVLQQLWTTAQAISTDSRGTLSLAALACGLEQAGYRDLPTATLRCLRARLSAAPPLSLNPPADASPDPATDQESQGPDPEVTPDPSPLAVDVPPADPLPAQTVQTQTADGVPTDAAEQAPGPQTPLPDSQPPVVDAVAVEVLPSAAVVERTPIRYAGLALVLPILQQFFSPRLRQSWEQAWGQRPWLYRPVELVTAFVLDLLCGFFNPEQVKATAARDLGPLLGHRRAPATVTFRRRFAAMCRDTQQVLAVAEELALQYLQLGWVQLDWWAIDNHFVPYFGKHNVGKAWWTQRRYAHKGHCQGSVHDARGRPLLLRFSQAFQLFQDELPAIARQVQDLLRRHGETQPMIAVFDRGGALAPVFRALDAAGIAWLSYRRGAVHLPPETFQHQVEIRGRTLWYAEHRFRVDGYHDAVAGVVWHDGDVQHQTALLCNFDRYLPQRYVPAELIAIPKARWAQETAFKSEERYTDLGWTNGYRHEPCAQTAVPNPQWRDCEHKLGKARQRLERHLRRPEPKTRQAQAKRRRRTGTLRAAVTRLTHRLAQTSATVPYGTLGRKATEQLHAGRATLVPLIRILAYHVRLQFRDIIAQGSCDLRELDKVIRLMFSQPGAYLRLPAEDIVQIEAPALPRFAKIAAALVAHANNAGAHAPRHPDRPLRFELVTRALP